MRSGFWETQEPIIASPGTWQILSEHILIVVTKLQLVRISKKTRQRSIIGKYTVLIPQNHTLGQLLKEAGGNSGRWLQTTDDNSSERDHFLSKDLRSIESVNWTHGTEVHIVI